MRWRTRKWAGSRARVPGAQSLARELYGRLEEDWLLIADRSFYQVL